MSDLIKAQLGEVLRRGIEDLRKQQAEAREKRELVSLRLERIRREIEDYEQRLELLTEPDA